MCVSDEGWREHGVGGKQECGSGGSSRYQLTPLPDGADRLLGLGRVSHPVLWFFYDYEQKPVPSEEFQFPPPCPPIPFGCCFCSSM